MNDFDFFYIEAHSDSIRQMKSAGIPRTKIDTHTQWGGRFPTKSYTAFLKSFDVMGVGHQRAR